MAFKNNNGTIDIYDWKRSKEIKCSNKFQKFSTKSYVSHLPDINFTHYSLQLNAYKYILEKNYDLKVSNMFIVCLHPDNKNENYLLFPIKDMKNDIHNIFLNYKNWKLNKKEKKNKKYRYINIIFFRYRYINIIYINNKKR